ncbi:hypothetical protein EN817_02905 [Mesorhizobium sp. M3A.F.Ca.ET.174.01.1.1]|uniref:hypothetical protein n=1 Tax=unclassified Mesorhizobium TaxID=325217 RepID=UPI001093A9B4|nr:MULTISPECIES: hypothetical protein [unclassified Mesorhizobium]TGS89315.1 hypothetical protein EN818_02905 [Mesorhizobium sp. M3A.F.Ca.ET.175.01.1.1]TGT31088.1 hypothetical protein EN817_02905 [Mesorhizobium sp. M3A.F.Ca.ET.174.01.1.1]
MTGDKDHFKADEPRKRPIDKLRESAGVMDVGDSSEGAVAGMVPTKKSLFIVKERAVYALQLADHVDPKRENIHVPNSMQLVAKSGSQSNEVSRTLLTAEALFTKSFFSSDEVREACLMASIATMKELLAVAQIADQFKADQEAAEQSYDAVPKSRALRLPAVTEVESRAKNFILKAESTLQSIVDIAGVFYREELAAKGWPDTLVVAVETRAGREANFTKFARALADFIKFMRNARHCIIHRDHTKWLELSDFRLTPQNTVEPPSIAIVHPDTPMSEVPLLTFMTDVVDKIGEGAEQLMAHLAGAHMEPPGKFPIIVNLVPEEQRRKDTQVRYGYFIRMGNEWVKLG